MKEKVSWTIDEEIIKEIEREAKKNQRSSSYVVNGILIKHYSKKGK